MNTLKEYISGLRTDYGISELDEKTVDKNPFVQFEMWMEDAIARQTDEPNAMVLATVTSGGKPSARIVLLRGFDENGFVFYTNYQSNKGQDLNVNPSACLHFFWHKVQRQVIIKGTAEKIDTKSSDLYFNSRPRESQLGAWASDQSKPVESRKEIERKFSMYEEKYKNADVMRPPHWGGYVVKPSEFEFWQGRENRLHDRIHFSKDEKDKWKIQRLNP
jgi:pyridoxamine 5'-phosphate oxidase